MKFIIQSLPTGGDTWLFRKDCKDALQATLSLHDTIKEDVRLKVAHGNSYRVIDKNKKVVFALTEEQKNKIIKS